MKLAIMFEQLERGLKLARVEIGEGMIDGEDHIKIVVDAEAGHQDLMIELEQAFVKRRREARLARHLHDGDDGGGDITERIDPKEDALIPRAYAREAEEIIADHGERPTQPLDDLSDELLGGHPSTIFFTRL